MLAQLNDKHQLPGSLTYCHSHGALLPVPTQPRGAAEGAEAVSDGASLMDSDPVLLAL